jgi:hypothetical protein
VWLTLKIAYKENLQCASGAHLAAAVEHSIFGGHSESNKLGFFFKFEASAQAGFSFFTADH